MTGSLASTCQNVNESHWGLFFVLKDTPSLFTGYDGTITQEVVNKVKSWLIDGEEVISYTGIKQEAIEFIYDMSDLSPQVATHLK
ncbi:hypothetical protein [Laceyella putida]|uniref:Uncharacterized protein n=1 Tax=Laceyella putida TaxID=110101 RepID=A0ABW2RKA9_9BACL